MGGAGTFRLGQCVKAALALGRATDDHLCFFRILRSKSLCVLLTVTYRIQDKETVHVPLTCILSTDMLVALAAGLVESLAGVEHWLSSVACMSCLDDLLIHHCSYLFILCRICCVHAHTVPVKRRAHRF